MRYLDFTSIPCDERGSKIFRGNASLRLREFSPCLIFSSFHDRESLDRIIPFLSDRIFIVALFLRVL